MSQISAQLFMDKLAVKVDPKAFLTYTKGYRDPNAYKRLSDGIKAARIRDRLDRIAYKAKEAIANGLPEDAVRKEADRLTALIKNTFPSGYDLALWEKAATPNTGKALGVMEIRNRLAAGTLPTEGMVLSNKHVGDWLFGPRPGKIPFGAYTDWFRKVNPEFATPLAGPVGKLPKGFVPEQLADLTNFLKS